MSRHVVWLTVALIVVTILSACQVAAPTAPPQAAPEATEAAPAPKPEKLTVLCGAQEDWCQALTQAFEAKTGIKTSYVRMSSGEALARIRAGKDNPEFDVWHGGPADGYIAAKEEGLLEPYVSPLAAKIPEQLKDPEAYWTG
ncbi:MAG TPA: iron ABC transporter substrate-binding protein, partial [Anaerolineae bacterium]|nr:iron ABC transporter substrate-binding protein [Anaerolineae bacterium]